MESQEIISKLPYSKPFLFVDTIIDVNENAIKGSYRYAEDLDFYKGHFVGNPVTPGVILTETMAQIGVVCLGIFILNDNFTKDIVIALTSSEIDFIKPVYPNETVTVFSEKVYFRFGKLKCKVWMENQKKETVCKGYISGMMKL
ncbi:3-hydroxyacyl-ACP dehydratase FabZ family protein [Flavobacterium sp.]|jgi:3-hydroxyacyl-[acyl-carrier-protein] dehydratase|uniref:3-hydroxyacyl-ACP dehydratase FabZ family protein n=1 Tax=Flavobacterium sp. TaxID=239 RepID=UPI0022CBE9FB|nr:3-hydroxyacyl-ACP dehydratase FabZ family protein [Flavobacterium sp.]MCZ8227891.1 beta-hydroxyacyl-ACP dehydratase [Flavobacterium sp.]